jgi:hypothetical protein
MTINRSQGQVLEHVGIYLPPPSFTHGQLYMATSRSSSFVITVAIIATSFVITVAIIARQ